MKKNNWTLLILIFSGLFTGTLLANAVYTWTGWSWLAQGMSTRWHPAGDIGLMAYSLDLQIKWNVGTVVGLIISIWMFRKW